MGDIALSGSAIFKAGEGMSTEITVAEIEEVLDQSEGVVDAVSRYAWSDNWMTLSGSAGAKMVQGIVSDLAGIYLVSRDMSGSYSSRVEAEDIINVLRDSALRGLSIIRDQKGVTFIK